ncbi:MAG: cytochrome c [Pirellulaceae bacterium]
MLEIKRAGADRARELRPSPSLYATVLPEYESHVDHAGLIESLDGESFQRGKQIYERLCINCHGDRKQPGSLPTAPRFGSSPLKNGSDPFSMYQTLTHGFGFMVAQTWMVPRQKYDVIHYIREDYFRRRGDDTYVSIDDRYLATLPPGDTLGPEPVEVQPWAEMNYGPSLINTYEVPRIVAGEGPHLVYKGVAVRVDAGPGGVARGRAWMLFDHDLMSWATGWTANDSDPRFIDWNGIHFNGRHGVHPRVSGDVGFANPLVPGWGEPRTGSLADDQRVVGRDGRHYGPLPQPLGEVPGALRRWRSHDRGIRGRRDRDSRDARVGRTFDRRRVRLGRPTDFHAWIIDCRGERIAAHGGRIRASGYSTGSEWTLGDIGWTE